MKLLECGKIINTHGVRGEVKIDNFCDDGFFNENRDIYIDGQPFKVMSARDHKGFVLAVLQGVETVEQAMRLKNKIVTADRERIKLPEGHFIYSDIYGFEVFDLRKNCVIGSLKEVRENPASMLYVVEAGGRECLIPAVPAFSKKVDMQERRITVETIEGMLPDEN